MSQLEVPLPIELGLGTVQNASADAKNQISTASVVLKNLTAMDVKDRHGPTAVRNSIA